MQSALHITTHILPGHKIEVTAPELSVGSEVEIFIVAQATVATKRKAALELLDALPGHRLFPTSAAVDQHLQEERDAWDR